ncbi:MAG: T9SS C-terminal target domain-containing protein [Cytophagia bacterium]|nr:MAG: T9SS C-terminal target domain-containing protein [Cytophagia bacterium]
METKFLWLLKLIMLFWVFNNLQAQTITLTDDCTSPTNVTPGSGSFVNANTYLNANADVTAAMTPNGFLPICATANQRDGWVAFTAVSTSMVISYTPTTAENVAIVVYQNTCPLPNATSTLLQCVNSYGAGVTETVNVSATVGTVYLVRIIKVSGPSAAMTGKISIYTGPRSLSSGDLCTDAGNTTRTLSTTSCNVPFDVNARFFHNEQFTTTCVGGLTNFIDGWARIDLTQNQSIRVNYIHTTKDSEITIYSGGLGSANATICTGLTQVACGNNVGLASGTSLNEFVDYTSPLAGTNTFYIRVTNRTDRNSMTGTICISELIARDACTSAVAGIKVGDCSVRFDIPTDIAPIGDNGTTASGSNQPNITNATPDVWTYFDAVSATPDTYVLEYTSNNQIAFAVYETTAPSPLFCTTGLTGGTSLYAKRPDGTDAFIGAGSAVSGSLTIRINPGMRYYIRAGFASASINTICLYKSDKKSEDLFFSSAVLSNTGSDCGIQFNLLSGYEDNGSTGTNLNSINCASSKPAYDDGWATFNAVVGGTYIIEYNNDNKSSTVSNDVMLSIYRTPVVTKASNFGTNNRADFTSIDASPTTINLNDVGNGGDVSSEAPISITNNTIVDTGVGTLGDALAPAGGGEMWFRLASTAIAKVRLEVTTGTAYLEVFQMDGVGNIIDVTVDGGVNPKVLALERINAGNLIGAPASATAYYIRVVKVGATNLTGKLVIYYPGTNGANMTLVNTMCADNVVEGIETLTLTGSNIVAGNHYFIRVANKDNNRSTVGTLCIRDNSVLQGDLCSNATALLVGSCDVNLDIPTTFNNNQPLPVVPPCGTGFFRDYWIAVTATSTQMTIEYKSDGNIALAVYRGSCSNLTYLNCVNNLPDEGIESIKINNAIVGLVYYVRIMTLENVYIDGNICIYNNNERDVCDDNDMVTRVVGDCNLPFDVPASFDNSTLAGGGFVPYRDFAQVFPVVETGGSLTQTILTPYASTCDGNLAAVSPGSLPDQSAAKDAWIRVIGNGGDVTLLYNNREATSNPSLIVYTALKAVGPVNCGAGLDGAGNATAANQYACTNRVTTASLQTESVTFTTNAGQLYLVRILDLTGTGMTGRLCVSGGRQDYEDPCVNAGGGLPGPAARQVTVGQCSIPLNIVTGLNTCSVPNFTPAVLPTVVTIYDENFSNITWTSDPFGDAFWATTDNNPSSGYTGASGFRNMRMRNNSPASTVCTVTSTPISTVSRTSITVIWGARKHGSAPPVTLEWRSVAIGTWNPVTFTDVTNTGNWALVNSGTRIPLPAGAENILDLQFRFTSTSTNTGTVPNNNYRIDDFEVQGIAPAVAPTTYNGIATTDCVGNNKSCVGGDVWATVTIPSVCNPVTAATFTTSGTCTGAGYVWNTANNTCSCPANTIRPTFPNTFTVQYDNRDGLLTAATDVRMVIYDASVSGFNCANQNTYQCVGYSDSVGEGIEAATIQFAPSMPLTPTFPTAGKTYLIRIINKSATQSAFGTLCLMYGQTLSSSICPPPNCYGELEGEFVPFNVRGGTYVDVNTPSRTIPNCVTPGGSNPATNSTNPIRSQGWMSFTVPATAGYTAVTIQYNNDLTSGSDPNAAIAVYTAPNMPLQTGTNSCPTAPNTTPAAIIAANCVDFSGNANGIQYLACSNSVFQGPETLTFTVQKGRTYYVRVMNVDNVDNPSDLNGLIRVFPFAQCSPGPELVTDGKFDMWPDIRATGGTPLTAATRADNTTPVWTTSSPTGAQDAAMNTARNTYDTRLDAYVLQTPNVDNDDAYPNNLDNNATTGIARFATDYGFVRDISSANLPTTGGGSPSTSLTYAQARSEQGELNPEGRYLIRQTPWTVKGDWYGYGNGYSGYGGNWGWGNTNYWYCSTGNGGANDEACAPINRGLTFGTTNGSYNDPQARWTSSGVYFDRPRALPDTREANFMIVNGSYDPNNSLPPGKVWCQTINRGASAGKVGYYIFSVWVQNMISGGRNLDVPMMRMTVCDMEDPTTGALPAEVDVDPSAAVRLSRLPGVTDVLGTGGAVLGTVRHFPIPPVDRVKAPRVDFSYGAAMTCNLSSEARDRRLKTLGASFLVTETPDRWKPIRCVYRAPQNITEMNICLENLSLTANGNDFAIDDISFYECLNPDAETFDKLLKGDPCELTDNPQTVDILLGASMLDFSGKLVGDRVILNWLATREDQTVRYEIQRSHDGTNFYAIGSLDARGVLSGITAEYNYTDRDLPIGINTLYYRLNIVENNGYSRFSNMISVGIKGIETFDLQLVPNPVNANDEVEVRFNVPLGIANIGVFDMMGTKLMSSQMTTSNGDNRIMISTKGMTTGLYLVKVIHNGKSVTKKLIVR